ncbi:PREDICTED: reverse mRNAase, partial [Prunus dulcis]
KACPCSANYALEAEALAAVEACFFAIEHQFRQVQLEIDCREVIHGVQGNISRGQWELYPFLCKIKEHLDHPNFVDTSWAWCPRTANVVADDTATLASARMNLVTWVNKPPSSLVHVLNNDGRPCPHFLVACLQSARQRNRHSIIYGLTLTIYGCWTPIVDSTGKWNWNWELIRMINGDMALDVTLEGIVL